MVQWKTILTFSPKDADICTTLGAKTLSPTLTHFAWVQLRVARLALRGMSPFQGFGNLWDLKPGPPLADSLRPRLSHTGLSARELCSTLRADPTERGLMIASHPRCLPGLMFYHKTMVLMIL